MAHFKEQKEQKYLNVRMGFILISFTLPLSLDSDSAEEETVYAEKEEGQQQSTFVVWTTHGTDLVHESKESGTASFWSGTEGGRKGTGKKERRAFRDKLKLNFY